jgi:hypothetical protein
LRAADTNVLADHNCNKENYLTDITDIEEERQARREYRRAVHDAAHAVRTFQAQLTELTTHIAFAGPLRRELAAKPIGAVVTVNEEVLLATADPRVAALVKVSRSIDEAVAILYAKQMEK